MNERPKIIQFAGAAPRNDHRWTTAELKRLISMWMAGDEVDSIALVFGVTPRGINRQIQRMRANGILVPRRKRGHRAGRSNQLFWDAERLRDAVSLRGISDKAETDPARLLSADES